MRIKHLLKSLYNKISEKLFKSKKTGRIYVISDLHIGHTNIIRYCKRPFKNTNVMNHELVSRWNGAVTNKDSVFFLGDFIISGHIGYWINRLNGKKTFIRGNHDRKLKHTIPNKILYYRGYRFLLIHNPHKIPRNWSGWVIYGHIHNSNLLKYPFIDGKNKRINVSAEVIDYRPLSLDYLVSLNLSAIKRKTTLNTRTEYW